jgi:hypothetical protein
VLISQTLSEKQFHNSFVVNAKIKISKHSEYILEICIENNKYFPPTHFSIVKNRLFKKVDQKNYRSKWYTPLRSRQKKYFESRLNRKLTKY